MAAKSKSQSSRKRGNKKAPVRDYGSISNGGIKRLARRAGVKRMSADSFGPIRDAFDRFVDRLVTNSYNYAECRSARTITPQDVVYALQKQGRNLYGYVFDKKSQQKVEDNDKE